MGAIATYKADPVRYNYSKLEENSSGSFFDNPNIDQTADENWLSTRKAAAYLGITPNALRIRVHRGQIEASKFRTHLRFSLLVLRMLLIKKEY